jgi:hypothetical protein
MRANEAAEYMKLSIQMLAKLRWLGGGPRYAKLGSVILYDRDDLDAWLSAHTCSSTSDYESLPRDNTAVKDCS